MYAVIATGGKQYRVEKNATLKVEKLDAEPGSTVAVRRSPAGRRWRQHQGRQAPRGRREVSATVEKHGQGEKKVIVKFRRRKHYKRGGNHRQQYTLVKITGIA